MAVFVVIGHKININSVVKLRKTKSAKSYSVIGVTPKIHNSYSLSNTSSALQTLHTLSTTTAQGGWHYPHLEVRSQGSEQLNTLSKAIALAWAPAIESRPF